MWNELFLLPFLTGLVLAIVLPVLGAYLRLRDEWLAALSYAHIAAAGALLALVASVPPAVGGIGAALAAGAGKRFFAARLSGGASYALLLLGSWSVAVLLAANHPLAERLGHALTPEGAAATVACDGILSAYRTRQSGWYAQGVYQFTPNWRAGLRYEQLDSGRRDFGDNAAYLVVDSYRPKKTSAMVDYSWSEYARVRLQYAQDRSMSGLTDHQVTVQYIMSLGAHGAHKF